MVRSDNGTEFLNKELKLKFQKLGIVHQLSCVETPQQNGRAERKHKHLLAVARALRFKASLPIHLWGDCLLTATYLINRTPTTVLNHQTPYSLLYNKPPLYSHLRIFGCLCYCSTLSKRQDKFYPRASKCVFLGYPHDTKGYRVMNLETNQMFVSRDVVFYETTFPYATSPASSSQLLFSPNPSFVDDLQHTYTSNTSCLSLTFSPESSSVHPSTSIQPFSTPPIPPPAPVRPTRTKTIPRKFTDFVGLPSCVTNSTSCVTQHPIQHTDSISHLKP